MLFRSLKDAVRLCRALTLANRAERPVIDAIRDYETDMIDYGFRAVRTSLHAMNQAVMEDRVRLMLSRAVLRIIDSVHHSNARCSIAWARNDAAQSKGE